MSESDAERGKRCDETPIERGHRRWVCWYDRESIETDGCWIWARSAEHAAEVWAEHAWFFHAWSKSAYPIKAYMRADAARPDQVMSFVVEVEHKPQFSAREVPK